MVEVGTIIQPNLINKGRYEWKNGKSGWELIQKLSNIPIPTILPELDKEGKGILEPEAFTEPRSRQLQNRSISKHLIKWKNIPVEDFTWKDKNFTQKHQELLKH